MIVKLNHKNKNKISSDKCWKYGKELLIITTIISLSLLFNTIFSPSVKISNVSPNSKLKY